MIQIWKVVPEVKSGFFDFLFLISIWRFSFFCNILLSQDKIALKKRTDMVSHDRQRFIKLLTQVRWDVYEESVFSRNTSLIMLLFMFILYYFQIMSRTLRIFHKVPSLEKKLLKGQQDVINLVVPSTAANLEKAFSWPKLNAEHVCYKFRIFKS